MSKLKNDTYTDEEKKFNYRRKKSRVQKLYEDYQNLSKIEKDNFINLLKNNY